jgi:hypothetical protein
LRPPGIIVGRNQDSHYWHVGDYFLTAYPTPEGWEVRVRGQAWGATGLLLDGHFATEAEALDWCARLAAVFARDQADD